MDFLFWTGTTSIRGTRCPARTRWRRLWPCPASACANANAPRAVSCSPPTAAAARNRPVLPSVRRHFSVCCCWFHFASFFESDDRSASPVDLECGCSFFSFLFFVLQPSVGSARSAAIRRRRRPVRRPTARSRHSTVAPRSPCRRR